MCLLHAMEDKEMRCRTGTNWPTKLFDWNIQWLKWLINWIWEASGIKEASVQMNNGMNKALFKEYLGPAVIVSYRNVEFLQEKLFCFPRSKTGSLNNISNPCRMPHDTQPTSHATPFLEKDQEACCGWKDAQNKHNIVNKFRCTAIIHSRRLKACQEQICHALAIIS